MVVVNSTIVMVIINIKYNIHFDHDLIVGSTMKFFSEYEKSLENKNTQTQTQRIHCGQAFRP